MTTAQASPLSTLSFDDLYIISDSLHIALTQTTRKDKQRKIAALLMQVDQILADA